MSRREHSAKAYFITGLAIILLSSAFAAPFIMPALEEWDARRTWAKVPCVITKSEYEFNQGTGGRSSRRRSKYFPIIHYSYEYGGESYTGERFRLNRQGFRGNRIAEIHERFVLGSNQICHVNPADPTQAVLDPWTPEFLYGAALTLPFLFIGGTAIITGFRKRSASG